ncbi:MAG: tRNA epoxyqueuosine(34) reductase QueG [Bacteroidetes bacterium]|jgi:epoxyqueuosine reductase|nr:tRNA epoxyqueuosine(34) reductase QueG [Bacteroidota bacterium]
MSEIRQYITQWALDEGFTAVGFSKAEKLEREADFLPDWIQQGRPGKMSYLERNVDMRTDPTLLHPGTKTVISFVFNYFQNNPTLSQSPKISTYALGRDYHKVLKKKLKSISKKIIENIAPEANIRYFTDSAPILEKEWARRAGLGWVGKNALLIHPKRGSYFFLAEMLIDIDMDDEPELAIKDHCGTCTRCIDACPTGAIDPQGYTIFASKCISYLTIELKDEVIDPVFKHKMEGWAFGCDICQQVCPWNKFASPQQEADFNPVSELNNLTASDWEEMTQEEFDRIFFQSPIKRTGLSGMQRNVNFLDSSDTNQV